MDTKADSTRAIPPYFSYATLRNYLATLKTGMPGRIDRSVLRNLSGANQTGVIGALRFLRLIDAEGHPSPQLDKLRVAEGPEWQAQLAAVLRGSYPTLFESGFNLATVTPRQLAERFEKLGITGDTVRKSVAFFVLAAKDAGLTMSPHVRIAARSLRMGVPRPQRRNGSEAEPGREKPPLPPPARGLQADLLAKFPTLDPAWPDEVKAKWFEAFQQLMKSLHP